MEHRFYKKTKREQNRIQLIVGACMLIIVIAALLLAWLIKFYFLAAVVILIALSVAAPFFDAPSLKSRERITYFSPLFIGERPQEGTIKIHGGTLFDYVFVLDKNQTGKQRTLFIIQQYLQGLIELINHCENTEQTELKIKGTSYIINERTASKIGFTVTETDYLQKMILLYNYFNVLVTSSFAKKKITFPKLSNTRTFEANLADLIEQKAYIEKLNQLFLNRLSC